MPTYVVDPVGIGRIPKYSHEDLNIVAMDQRISDLEKRCVTLDATLTMKTSHYDALEDDVNIVKLAVEQHTTCLRAIEHPSKGAKKLHHSHSVIPVESHIPSPPVLSSAMTKHAEAPSVPVRSEHGKETETIVDFNLPSTSTSTVTAATTATSAISPERSIGLAPSYSQLAKDLKLKPAGIRTDDFADFQPVARKRRPKARVVAGKSISGNTFKGGPKPAMCFCSVSTVMLMRLLSRNT